MVRHSNTFDARTLDHATSTLVLREPRSDVASGLGLGLVGDLVLMSVVLQSDATQPAPEAGTWFQAYFVTLVQRANPAL